MTEFTTFLRNRLLDEALRAVQWTPPAVVYVSLYTTACSTDARGAEVSGPGYARQAITFGAASGGRSLNTSSHNFVVASGSWGQVVALGIEDAASGGNQLAFDNGFGHYQMNSGDTIGLAPGSVSIEM